MNAAQQIISSLLLIAVVATLSAVVLVLLKDYIAPQSTVMISSARAVRYGDTLFIALCLVKRSSSDLESIDIYVDTEGHRRVANILNPSILPSGENMVCMRAYVDNFTAQIDRVAIVTGYRLSNGVAGTASAIALIEKI
jgi:hypothetical protein